MPTVGGFTYQNNGALNVTEKGGIIASSAPRVNGWAIATDGGAYIEDSTTALPSGVYRMGGRAFTADGALCITTGAIAAGDILFQGVRIRVDGAVYVNAGTPSSATLVAGMALDSAGKIYINSVHSNSDILLEDGSFLLQEDGLSTFLME